MPAPERLIALAHWDCIDFISDLHLDAARPRVFHAWANYLFNTPAHAVFILGDLFEAWIGNDTAQQEGFEAQGIRVLREAAQRCWIGFMPGNRDFLLGMDLLQSCGIQLLSDPTVLQAYGQQLLLTHGDLLCVDDANYQRFRSQVRDPIWQTAFLARPLLERRALAKAMRDASREHQNNPAAWADIDVHMAQSWLNAAGCKVLVHGHTHRPGSESWPSALERHVLSDWELDGPGPNRAQVLRLTGEGFLRLDLGF
ncbi:UDP-2,3-diacylglucosamine diphosphatase [Azohydromonas sp. G-1-1-14]|uniref:UDP-2,3-diacylglucosamine hydrolase n=1 Tax=Azohydromonas caseinilytica TaxID=2728836 RepID=A0A848FB11_9BURK|nr:UDP-2,3-diacylglucosamine diphosphatase [Azohydromonas caseinilytica]